MERLIGNIYDALEDEQLYAQLPSLLAEASGGRSATLMLHGTDGSLEEIHTHYFTEEMCQYYDEHRIYLFDEWSKVMARETGQDGKVIRVADFQPIQDFKESFFCREFLRRFGDDSIHCVGFALQRSDGGLITFGVHKGEERHGFSRKEQKILKLIQPHLERMVLLRRKLSQAEGVTTGAKLGIDSIEDAYLVVRPDRSILFANASAEALLHEAQLLKSSAGRLELESRAGDDRLTRCLHDVLGRKVEGRTAFVARDRSGQVWRFTLAPKAVDGRTMVLVWIDRGKVGATAPERLQQLYELTSAEVPILMALSEGRSAQEIADLQSVSVATIRTHIQHIYTKTDVNKASQLATLVASLPKV